MLFIVSQMGRGGTERRAVDLMNGLGEEFDVRLLSLKGRRFYTTVERDQRTEQNSFLRMIGNIRYLRTVLGSVKPDLVQCFDAESGIYAAMAMRMFRSRSRVPLVSGIGTNGLFDARTRRALAYRCCLPDLFISNCRGGSHALNRAVSHRVPCRVIPNGLDTARLEGYLAADDPRATAWRHAKGPIIGYVGRADHDKRGERMVDVAIRLADHPSQPTFVMIGGGGRWQEAKEKMSACRSLQGRAFFLGEMSDAASLARYFDIGVLCSDVEGLPNVLLEYMYLRKPIVTTNAGDAAFVLDEGRAGSIVDRRNAIVGIAGAIAGLVENRELYQRLATAGRERFDALFCLEVAIDHYRTLYSDLLGGKAVAA